MHLSTIQWLMGAVGHSCSKNCIFADTYIRRWLFRKDLTIMQWSSTNKIADAILYCFLFSNNLLIYIWCEWHVRQVFASNTQIAMFMGPTWGPSGSCRPQLGPMLAPWTLLSGNLNMNRAGTTKKATANVLKEYPHAISSYSNLEFT